MSDYEDWLRALAKRRAKWVDEKENVKHWNECADRIATLEAERDSIRSRHHDLRRAVDTFLFSNPQTHPAAEYQALDRAFELLDEPTPTPPPAEDEI